MPQAILAIPGWIATATSAFAANTAAYFGASVTTVKLISTAVYYGVYYGSQLAIFAGPAKHPSPCCPEAIH